MESLVSTIVRRKNQDQIDQGEAQVRSPSAYLNIPQDMRNKYTSKKYPNWLVSRYLPGFQEDEFDDDDIEFLGIEFSNYSWEPPYGPFMYGFALDCDLLLAMMNDIEEWDDKKKQFEYAQACYRMLREKLALYGSELSNKFIQWILGPWATFYNKETKMHEYYQVEWGRNIPRIPRRMFPMEIVSYNYVDDYKESGYYDFYEQKLHNPSNYPIEYVRIGLFSHHKGCMNMDISPKEIDTIDKFKGFLLSLIIVLNKEFSGEDRLRMNRKSLKLEINTSIHQSKLFHEQMLTVFNDIFNYNVKRIPLRGPCPCKRMLELHEKCVSCVPQTFIDWFVDYRPYDKIDMITMARIANEYCSQFTYRGSLTFADFCERHAVYEYPCQIHMKSCKSVLKCTLCNECIIPGEAPQPCYICGQIDKCYENIKNNSGEWRIIKEDVEKYFAEPDDSNRSRYLFEIQYWNPGLPFVVDHYFDCKTRYNKDKN